MNHVQALKRYRSLTIELTALEQQLRQVERTGRPSGVIAQQYDRLRGTNDPTSAAIQLADGLEAMAEAKRAELARLRPQVDAALALVSDFRLMIVLRAYYLAGETDEQAAETVHLSDRYVCRMRNDFLRSLGCTSSAQ